MPPPANSGLLRVSLFGASGSLGFSESYLLKDSVPSFSAGIPIGQQIALRRQACLAAEDSIIWARIAFTDSLHRSKALISGPLIGFNDPDPPAASIGRTTVNKVADGLLLRFETADGQYGNRIMRSIPDVKLVDELWTDAPVTFPAPAAAPKIATDPWLDAFKDFVAYVRDNTTWAHKTSNSPLTYDTFDWATVVFRRSAMKRTGRVFGTPVGAYSR